MGCEGGDGVAAYIHRFLGFIDPGPECLIASRLSCTSHKGRGSVEERVPVGVVYGPKICRPPSLLAQVGGDVLARRDHADEGDDVCAFVAAGIDGEDDGLRTGARV